MWKLLILALLASCGSKDDSSSDSTDHSSEWTSENVLTSTNSCKNSAKLAAPSITDAQATTYCACMVGEIEKRYGPEDADRKAFEVSQALKEDGTAERCTKAAGL